MEERKKDELKKQEMETKEQSEQISREQQGDKVRNSRNGKRNVGSIMLVELLCILLGISLLVLIYDGTNFSLAKYIDIPALILILLFALPTFISSGLWKDFLRAFRLNKEGIHWKLSELKRTLEAVEHLQKQLLYSFCMIAMFQIVDVLYRMQEPSSIGPILAMILLSGVYVAIMELLLMPLKVETKKQIIEYMEEETE